MKNVRMNFSKLRVLVIENHLLMRQILKEMLHGFGVKSSNIISARNVPEGLTAIYQSHFDLIVLDFFLGDFDGGDFTRHVRCDQTCRNRKAPILLITSAPDHSRIFKAKEVGVDDVLAKPFSPKDLYWRIYMLLNRPRQFVAAQNSTGPGQIMKASQKLEKQRARQRELLRRSGKQAITQMQPFNKPEKQEIEEIEMVSSPQEQTPQIKGAWLSER